MNYKILEKLVAIVRDRKANPKEGSYTNSLFEAGENKIIKKLGEEFVEVLKAYLTEGEDRTASEVADFVYHLIVALEYKGYKFEKVLDELAKRFK